MSKSPMTMALGPAPASPGSLLEPLRKSVAAVLWPALLALLALYAAVLAASGGEYDLGLPQEVVASATASLGPATVAQAAGGACPDSPTPFVVFFSGHAGSSALMDSLSRIPGVLVPAFEPLDAPGLTESQKLAWIQAAFAPPPPGSGNDAWGAWRDALAENGARLTLPEDFAAQGLPCVRAVGFKMRPYEGAMQSAPHTAATGLDPWALRDELSRHQARVVVVMRRNRVLQALSWYRARVLGVNQWSPLALRRALEEAGYVADPQVLAWLLEFFDDANRRIENAAVFHGRPTLLVWHEDLLADPHSTICRVAAFLGLSDVDDPSPSKFVKATPDAEALDAVANVGDLAEMFHDTPYCADLGPDLCREAQEFARHDPTGWRDVQAAARIALTRLRRDQAQQGRVTEGFQTRDKHRRGWSCVERDMAATGGAFAEMTPQECGAVVDQLNSQRVLDAHRMPSASVVPVFFKHEHKAGGTTLCALAGAVTETAQGTLLEDPSWGTNCVPPETFQPGQALWRLDLSAWQEPTAMLPWGGKACWAQNLSVVAQRAVFDHFTGLGFLASEGAMPDPVALDVPYATVTMLRDPLDRTLSSYHWWASVVDRFSDRDGGRDAAICQAFWAPPGSTLEQFLAVYPDNWQTRSLLGRSAMAGRFQGPFSGGRLSREDLRVAVARLHYFTAVLIVEDMEGSLTKMQRMFGWRLPEDAAMQHRLRRAQGPTDARAELRGQRELQHLHDMHDIDLLFYEHAVELHCEQLEMLVLTSIFCMTRRGEEQLLRES